MQVMVQAQILDPILQEIVSRLLGAGEPQKIILFGSHTRREVNDESDYDLLVIEPSVVSRFRRAARYRRALKDFGYSKDIVVWTPDEVAEWQNVPDAFVTTALREGIVLYEG